MCRFGDSHETHTRCRAEPRNGCGVPRGAPSRFTLTSPTEQVHLSGALSIFLFDWDDTLFPTTALQSVGPAQLCDVLSDVDAVVAEILTAILATPTNRVIILTNARSEWVHHAVQNFMPKVHELLGDHQDGQLLLLSAHKDRSKFTDAARYEEAMRTSKSEVMRPLSTALRPVVDKIGAPSLQVISVGDQPHDLAAGHALCGLMCSQECRFEQSFVKTVAMKPMPTGVELAKQLGILCRALPKISSAARSFHQSMCQAQVSSTRCPSSTAQAQEAAENLKLPTLLQSSTVPGKSPAILAQEAQTVEPVSVSNIDAPSSKGQFESVERSGPLSRRDRGNTWQGSVGDEAKEAKLER